MTTAKLTHDQAAIIGLFTGIACGPFADIQRLGDRLLGQPTWTHQYANETFIAELKRLVTPEFMAICAVPE